MNRITVLFGNYGSGKTELALNIALSLKRKNEKVTLVDLDIVNPYFRSSEKRAMLEDKGIRVIAPQYANTGVDLPTVPPEVFSVLSDGFVVLDCGGDPVGAKALGSLKANFDKVRLETEVLYVINTKRPYQQSAEIIQKSLELIQGNARINADGFVLNSNLGWETSGEELAEGYKIVKELIRLTGIPLLYVSGSEKALEVFNKKCPEYTGETLKMKIFMRPEWM